MAGRNVPYVLFPSPTGFVGNLAYRSPPMAVSEYAGVTLDLWVGAFIGTGTPAATFTLEESNDAEQFGDCQGSFASIVISSIAAPTEFQLSAPLSKAWLRVFVGLTGTNPGFTCWGTGFLERREK